MMKVWRNGQRSGFKITDLEFHVLRKPWHQMVWQLAVVGIEAGDTLLEANIDYGLNFKETLQHIYGKMIITQAICCLRLRLTIL